MGDGTMLILSAEDLRRAVPMEQAMEAVASAFAQLADQQADVPLRLRLAVPSQEGIALVMPAYLAESGALGLKLLSIFPHNPELHRLPVINALVLLLDTENGLPLALMDGGRLTALRTGAASGVATRLMARQDARVLALFGAGAQALPQAWAVCEARSIDHIWLVNRTPAHAERLAAQLRGFGPPIPADVRVAPSARDALREADVICCATSSTKPLFADADLRPGVHINAIGSYLPTMQEVPAATVARARVIVDERRAAWAEAGDLIIPRDQGLIAEAHIVGELGEVVTRRVAGRTAPDQITFFKSVGLAVQDVATAQATYQQARTLGIGTEVKL
jgi:ornithine cyclodeaminase